MTDLTGFSQLGRNVVVSWSVQIIVLIAGFVVPRQISDSLGQDALGIWDLGWATLRYLTLANLGVGSALSRFAALQRSAGDTDALSQTTTIVSIWQLLIAAITAGVAVLLATAITGWVDLPDPHDAETAQIVLLMLGLTLAVKMLANPAGSLISGFHRWDIQHSINAGQDLLIAVVLVSMLFMDAALTDLAYAVFGIGVLTAVVRIAIARKLAPDIKLKLSLWDTSKALELLRFGIKTLVNTASNVIVYQTTAVLLAGFAGPAALAVYNRGLALVSHCEQLITKAAQMFMPITSSLIGLDRENDTRELLESVGRYGLSIALPMMLFLAFFGDLALELWMGEGYANAPLMWALTLGSLIRLSQIGTFNVLAGLNAHGKVALASLVVAALSLIAMLPVAASMGWSPVTAAIVVSVCLSLAKGLVIPYYLWRDYQISIWRYVSQSIFLPIFWNIPLIGAIAFARQAFDQQQWILCLAALFGGGVVTLLVYWRWMLPEAARTALIARLRPTAAAQ